MTCLHKNRCTLKQYKATGLIRNKTMNWTIRNVGWLTWLLHFIKYTKLHYANVSLHTSPMPPTSKHKSGLVKVPVHFNVY